MPSLGSSTSFIRHLMLCYIMRRIVVEIRANATLPVSYVLAVRSVKIN
jgi:hypothetical protein